MIGKTIVTTLYLSRPLLFAGTKVSGILFYSSDKTEFALEQMALEIWPS